MFRCVGVLLVNAQGAISPLLTQAIEGTALILFTVEGNPRMHGTLPPGFELSSRTSDFMRYSCQEVVFPNAMLVLRVSPNYLDYENCFCADAFYGAPPNQCYDCPASATCFGGVCACCFSLIRLCVTL